MDRDWVIIWDEEGDASVEVISNSDKRVDDALMLARVWLHGMGADADAWLLDDTVESLEPDIGYFAARNQVFQAFYMGFAGHEVPSPNDKTIVACWRAGVTAARLNEAAGKAQTFPELNAAPFDTDTARAAFSRALSHGG